MSSTIIGISVGFRPSKIEPIYLSLLRAGRPSAFTNEDLSILKEIIGENTFFYLDQVVVSVIPISRALALWREIAPDPNSPKQICLGLSEALICTLIYGKFARMGPGAVPPGAQANLRKLALRNRAN